MVERRGKGGGGGDGGGGGGGGGSASLGNQVHQARLTERRHQSSGAAV